MTEHQHSKRLPALCNTTVKIRKHCDFTYIFFKEKKPTSHKSENKSSDILPFYSNSFNNLHN